MKSVSCSYRRGVCPAACSLGSGAGSGSGAGPGSASGAGSSLYAEGPDARAALHRPAASRRAEAEQRRTLQRNRKQETQNQSSGLWVLVPLVSLVSLVNGLHQVTRPESRCSVTSLYCSPLLCSLKQLE